MAQRVGPQQPAARISSADAQVHHSPLAALTEPHSISHSIHGSNRFSPLACLSAQPVKPVQLLHDACLSSLSAPCRRARVPVTATHRCRHVPKCTRFMAILITLQGPITWLCPAASGPTQWPLAVGQRQSHSNNNSKPLPPLVSPHPGPRSPLGRSLTPAAPPWTSGRLGAASKLAIATAIAQVRSSSMSST